MDPKLIFWTLALLNTTALVVCGFLGWREIRRGNIERHRRWMHAAMFLVLVFLVSYVFKVVLLGKEDRQLWSSTSITILRIHETLVLVMILAGGAARFVARRFGSPKDAKDARKRHRLLGKTAVISSLFALLTAAMVLVGMYMR